MAKCTRDQLTRLRGIGDILAGRLKDEGIDTFVKVAAAGEEGLKKIKGMNPRAIPSILFQAGEIVSAAEAEREGFLQEMREKALGLIGRVQALAADVRDRFSAEITGKDGKRVEKEILRILALLELPVAKSRKMGKKAAKCLARTEERLSVFAGAELKYIRKGLKKTRKSLERIGV